MLKMLHTVETLKKLVLEVKNNDFEEIALAIFAYQYKNNSLYARFVSQLNVDVPNIRKIQQIPCLPIEFFKYHAVRSVATPIRSIFRSSGTTNQTQRSEHCISDVEFYTRISLQIFEQNYGNIRNYHILALLPSYLEQENSSLVCMVKAFIERSESQMSGFYLHDFAKLSEKIKHLQKQNDRKILLIGVTYALLDFAEQYPHQSLRGATIVMETGGMKGRRKEIIREQVHEMLCKTWHLSEIHSEYGMTELLSQAYSKGKGIFECPSTMRILLREIQDPRTLTSKRGLINIIDLANIESCAFIATQDVGSMEENGSFKVLGRADNTEQRGCNLMIS